ncbi:OmpA family protein [Corallococcus sp. M34]|nr:OmpA family protein [Citreicoccus inhibens]
MARAQNVDETTSFPTHVQAAGSPGPRASSQSPGALPASARAENDAELISTREVIVAGNEPHSPATLHNAYADPRNLRRGSSSTGGVGLLRIAGADLGSPGLLRFGVVGEYSHGSDFPVRDATNSRTSGTFSLAYTPVEYLQAYAAYSASANTNSRTSPRLIQALGDVTFGARASRQWLPGLWAGVDVRLMTFSGVGDASVDKTAWGFAPKLVGTYDLHQLDARLPLRVHANLGLLFDGTQSLAGDAKLNASEEYALGINRYSRLALALGVEAPLPGVTPFLEYSRAQPLGTGGPLVSPDGRTLSAGSVAPQVLGLGARLTALKDLSFTAVAEFGLQRNVGLGVTPVPPFNLVVGAAYTVDVLGHEPTKVVEQVRERKVAPPAPKLAQVSGTVMDAETHRPVGGVLVAVAGLPPVATDAEAGRFLTYELTPGAVKLLVRKEGYHALTRELILQPGEKSVVELTLEREARPAQVSVSVASKKKPVTATVALQGPKPAQLDLSESASSPTLAELPAGAYVAVVTAPGYLAQTRAVQVAEGAPLTLAFDLEPEPKKKLVSIKDNKLELLQPLHFAEGKALLLPDNDAVLVQVVDALVRAGNHRVRVEAHTDNQGDKAANLQLSKDRAKAVVSALTRAGIDATRLESEGYGDSRPVAPNLTPRGRELNRRVELLILDR